MQLPPTVTPPTHVAIVAPASGLDDAALQARVSYLEALGCSCDVGQVTQPGPALESDVARAQELAAAMRSDASVILCARGGYGTTRLLDALDFAEFANRPKWVVGFSDITALQLAILKHTGIGSASGFLLYPSLDECGIARPRAGESLWQTLGGDFQPVRSLKCLRPGRAQGPLVGGCLSMITALVGTPHLPDLSGTLLFLEDVGERPYRIDRMLQQLWSAGVLQDVAGLIAGHFAGCHARGALDATVPDVLAHWASRVNCPAVTGLPYGHDIDSLVLPIGVPATLDADAGTLDLYPV